MTLIRVINSILEVSQKTTTYKFATLLAIFDYVIDHPEEKPINNFHFIPLVYLARQFLSYYYPLSFYNFSQGTPSGFAVYTQIENSFKNNLNLEDTTLQKAVKSNAEGIVWINQLYDSPEVIPKELVKLLLNFRKKIIDQPLKYIPNVAGAKKRFFGILNKSIAFDSTYEAHRKAAKGQKKPKDEMNWLELFRHDQTSLIIDDITYKEMARYRFWIRDVITKKWFEFSYRTETDKDKSAYKYGAFFNILNLAYMKEISRNSALISKYRNFFVEVGALESIFSGQTFDPAEAFHIDHFLPWSYYRVNRFWNLFPLEPDVNREKSNYLPSLTDQIEARMVTHLEKCLKAKADPLIRNDLRYFYLVLQKDTEFSLEASDDRETIEQILVAIRKDLKNLKKIIPGKEYKLKKE